MSALAHWLEHEGIATSLIALVRPHAERIAPPRALWVPFELGRPLGTPNDPAFQRRVLRAALGLLESEAGATVLADFPDDAPDATDDPDWTCPVALDASDLAGEVAQVRPWHERVVARTGRTTVGLAGLSVEDAAGYVAACAAGGPVERPRRGMSPAALLRFAADDLKAFYLEAATANGARPSSRQLTDWFWRETLAARTLRAIRDRAGADPDRHRARVAAGSLVPEPYRESA